MIVAELYLARSSSRLAAYNLLQCALMRRFVARGGTAEAWCDSMAPAFSRRYGWILEA